MMNIVEIITKTAKRQAGAIAVIDGDRSITYAQLIKAVDRTANQLKLEGLSRFDRVALLAEDGIDYIIISLAVIKLRAVIVPVPFGSSQEEAETLFKELQVNFLIKDNLPMIKLQAAGAVSKYFYKIDPAFIRFSSGTTGANKGVVLSHRSIIERTEAANKGLRVGPGEQVIWVLSMSFHFVVTILLFLRYGATTIISSRNFPQGLLDSLSRHRPTFIYASPLHYHLLSSLDIPKGALFGVRLAVSTAIKLPEQIAYKFSQKFGFPLAESYGIIEIGLPFVSISKSAVKPGSVGRILPGYKVQIINKDAQGTGEIQIKGKGMFDAYFSPWRLRKEAAPGGWFNTGDLGYLDKDGYLFILGRHKQVINFNGMKIFPFEIESLLNTHPLVRESQVFAKPHPEYGQLPAAKVVLKDQGATLDPEILRKFCYQHLAAYKVPKEFEFVAALPKTISGKLKL